MEPIVQLDVEPVLPSRKKIIVRNALVLSGILIFVLLAAHFFGYGHLSTRIAIGEYILLLVSIIVTQLEVRDKLFNGALPFDKAFGTGMMMVFIITAIFSVFTLIFYLFIAPELLTEMREIAENSLRAQGQPESEISDRMVMTNRIFTPAGMFLMSIIGYLFMGALMSLIASIFTQRKN